MGDGSFGGTFLSCQENQCQLLGRCEHLSAKQRWVTILSVVAIIISIVITEVIIAFTVFLFLVSLVTTLLRYDLSVMRI